MRFGGGGGGRALSNLVPKYDGQSSEACSCDSGGGDYKLGLAGRRKLFKKSKCHRHAHTGQVGQPWLRPCELSNNSTDVSPDLGVVLGARDTAKTLTSYPFERAAVLGQATRRQCGQGPRPSTWDQLGPVGLVSSGAGGDDKVLKPPSNDHSNGERNSQAVEGLTRSQVAWVNCSVQGGSG